MRLLPLVLLLILAAAAIPARPTVATAGDFNLSIGFGPVVGVAPPPPPPPAPVVVHYRYHYYPEAQVYYMVDRGEYYWCDAGRWRYGRHLPHHYVLRDHVVMDLDTDRPYVHHVTHVRKYPPGHYTQYDKHYDKHDDRGHGKGKGRGRGHDDW